MDSLRATYGDDEGEKISELSDSAPLDPVGDTIEGNRDTDVVVTDDKTGSNQQNGITEESEALAPEDLQSEGGSLSGSVTVTETDKIDQSVSENCPNLRAETDGNEDAEEEEPPAKRQKQIPEEPKPEKTEVGNTELASSSDAIIPPSNNGKAPTAKTGKKSKKKKTKDVWMSSSRKGKKKTKHASNNNFESKNGIEGDAAIGQKILITPIARFPDRNDDSSDLKICLSKVYKAEKVELSEDRLTASSIKGYRMARATRGVTAGAWYFEIKVVHLGETGHTRLGWSTEKGDLQAPVGYDGNSYGYRDIDGSKVHKALREKYGDEGYKEGDVLGFYINLPDGDSYAPKPPRLVWHKGQRYVTAPDPKEDPPKVVPGSEISYLKNGVCQGVAFTDLYGGRYYPAASMYTLPNQPPCVVKFNFGPEFECFPEDFGEHPVPRPMVEVPYQSYDGTVENGNPWNITRMCPMLKAIKEENCKIVKGAEMAD